MRQMDESKRSDSVCMTNGGPMPAHIRAKSGDIIWRQLRGYWRLPSPGDWELKINGEVNDSSHEYLILAVGGQVQVTVYTDGSTIAIGTGISTPREPPQSHDPTL